jgi:hypothetical protein
MFVDGGHRMTKKCPHCGASLPIVEDAFCFECRKALVEQRYHESDRHLSRDNPCTGLDADVQGRSSGNPLEQFSLPARIVIVLSLVTAVGGTAAYISWIYDDLSPGSYPLWLFAMPVLVVVGLLCLAGLGLLRAIGIPIYRKHNGAFSDGDDMEVPRRCDY